MIPGTKVEGGRYMAVHGDELTCDGCAFDKAQALCIRNDCRGPKGEPLKFVEVIDEKILNENLS